MQTDDKPRRKEGKRQRVRANMVNVYIMGKRHVVPEHATIMRAIEYAGHQIIRGAGCREGFCGACGTIYRLPGDYKLHTGLACTTLVKEGMSLTQIPSVPMEKAVYDLEKLTPTSMRSCKSIRSPSAASPAAHAARRARRGCR